ncbi:MAG: SDR family oxidoreductase, partial [Rhodospirillales bacterium]|nr:SDR family oxidoreductase [Rhodospirillales bacterium]
TYRVSKVALNAVTRVLALELEGSGILVNSLSPGWVRTDMGGPDGDVSADESAVVLRAIFENLSPADTGKYINYTGEDLPW